MYGKELFIHQTFIALILFSDKDGIVCEERQIQKNHHGKISGIFLFPANGKNATHIPNKW